MAVLRGNPVSVYVVPHRRSLDKVVYQYVRLGLLRVRVRYLEAARTLYYCIEIRRVRCRRRAVLQAEHACLVEVAYRRVVGCDHHRVIVAGGACTNSSEAVCDAREVPST